MKTILLAITASMSMSCAQPPLSQSAQGLGTCIEEPVLEGDVIPGCSDPTRIGAQPTVSMGISSYPSIQYVAAVACSWSGANHYAINCGVSIHLGGYSALLCHFELTNGGGIDLTNSFCWLE